MLHANAQLLRVVFPKIKKNLQTELLSECALLNVKNVVQFQLAFIQRSMEYSRAATHLRIGNIKQKKVYELGKVGRCSHASSASYIIEVHKLRGLFAI